MMPGITETLQKVAQQKGLNFDEWMGNLKHNNQFRVEVY
jgi:sulfite reductase alpha subunit-like flavoprotein